jgi:hypothetical protein
MRVTFPRLADHQQGYSVIERDDGVVYRMDGFTVMGTGLPHDLRHLIVERELRVGDGIFGAIAAGAVWTSMHHVRGRRSPHAGEQSDVLKRSQRDRIGRAELLANLVEAVAALDDPSPEQIRRLEGRHLSVVPLTTPGADPAGAVRLPPPEVLAAAASALQVEAARWARLRVGDQLEYEWPPGKPKPRVRVLRPAQEQQRTFTAKVPRQRDGGRHRPKPLPGQGTTVTGHLPAR